VSPLPIAHRSVDDGWIRSLAYDRVHGRLEVDYRWNDVRQYSPIPPGALPRTLERQTDEPDIEFDDQKPESP